MGQFTCPFDFHARFLQNHLLMHTLTTHTQKGNLMTFDFLRYSNASIYGHKCNIKPYNSVSCLLNHEFYGGFHAFTNVIAQWETILIKKRDKHVKQPMQSSVFDVDVFFSPACCETFIISFELTCGQAVRTNVHTYTCTRQQTNERTNLEIISDKMSTTSLNLHDNDLKYVLSVYLCMLWIYWLTVNTGIEYTIHGATIATERFCLICKRRLHSNKKEKREKFNIVSHFTYIIRILLGEWNDARFMLYRTTANTVSSSSNSNYIDDDDIEKIQFAT